MQKKCWDDPTNPNVSNGTATLFTILKLGTAVDEDTTTAASDPAGNFTAKSKAVSSPAEESHPLLPLLRPQPLVQIMAPPDSFNIHCSPHNTTINHLPVATAVEIPVNPVPSKTTPHLVHLAPSPPSRFVHLWASPSGGEGSPFQSNCSSYGGVATNYKNGRWTPSFNQNIVPFLRISF